MFPLRFRFFSSRRTVALGWHARRPPPAFGVKSKYPPSQYTSFLLATKCMQILYAHGGGSSSNPNRRLHTCICTRTPSRTTKNFQCTLFRLSDKDHGNNKSNLSKGVKQTAQTESMAGVCENVRTPLSSLGPEPSDLVPDSSSCST